MTSATLVGKSHKLQWATKVLSVSVAEVAFVFRKRSVLCVLVPQWPEVRRCSARKIEAGNLGKAGRSADRSRYPRGDEFQAARCINSKAPPEQEINSIEKRALPCGSITLGSHRLFDGRWGRWERCPWTNKRTKLSIANWNECLHRSEGRTWEECDIKVCIDRLKGTFSSGFAEKRETSGEKIRFLM